jgi:pimeloyl-ACP methyl ester carboxylesterase
MSPKRALAITAGLAAAAYAAYLGALYLLQGSFIYPGSRNPAAPQAPRVNGTELLRVATRGGTVDALLLPARGAATPQPLVLFAHGNGELIDDWVSSLDGFRERGIHVLLVEYPGYGRSSGSPSEGSIRMALDAAYDRIVQDPRVDRRRIFGFGQSLGGGAICLLARDRPLRALILQSTFTSLDTFTAPYWAPALLLRDHFDNLDTVRHFQAPLLVIHGREDPLIPLREARRLAAASAHATLRIYECGHGCWDPQHLPFWQDAVPFLRQAGILAPAPAE